MLQRPTQDGVLELNDTMHEVTHNLTSMGIPVQHWRHILLLKMIERFDEQTTNEWEKQRPDGALPTLHKVRDFLCADLMVLPILTLSRHEHFAALDPVGDVRM